MTLLADRRIVITGISRGIGFETARLFLEHGAEIVGTARDPERLERARQQLDPAGRHLSTVAADLRTAGAAVAVARAAEARWGAVDVLFNNAGVQVDGAAEGFADGSEAALEESLAVNLMAPYRFCLAFLPLLRRGREPRIVNVSSGAGNFESLRARGIASYRLSKWALNGLTLQLSAELMGEIAVNAFDPGWVKTDLGGPQAPGEPVESARGALDLVTHPTTETGKFWKDGREIPF